jgi:hypothetical protein
MRDKSNVILIEQLTRGKPRLNEIVGFLTDIDGYGHHGKEQHTE